MRTVKVEFELNVFDVVTLEEVEEWLRFELGETCQLLQSNPLSNKDVAAKRGSVRVRE